jgi:hypothetical protein
LLFLRSATEEKALAAVAANRDKAKIKNRCNRTILRGIPKVNRDKNARSASPYLRPCLKNRTK